jgi:hypothetical protein
MRGLAAERFRWLLLAAIGGAAGSIVSCGGHSTRVLSDEATNSGGVGGIGGEKGGTGGNNGTGAVSGAGAVSGTGAGGGNRATGGTGADGGTGAIGGSAGSVGGSISTGGTGAMFGCDVSETHASGLEACEGGFVHRPKAETCALPPHDSLSGEGGFGQGGATADAGAPGEVPIAEPCVADRDCIERANGYCIRPPFPDPFTSCVYACESDTDCPSGEVCSCDSFESHAGMGSITLGTCRRATCATDEDCEGAAMCISMASDMCGNARTGAFHCQRAGDECAGSGDCSRTESCWYDGTNHRCTENTPCAA